MDLWHSCGNHRDHSQQGEAGVQVHQDVAGARTVQVLWQDQQSHQAVDQSQKRCEQSLSHEDEGQVADWPLASRHRWLQIWK